MNLTVDFFIGTYSQTNEHFPANGDGIHAASIDLQTGALTKPSCAVPCVNPSYLAWGHNRTRLYATQELAAAEGAALVAFGRHGEQQLQLLQTVYLQGGLPCHVAVDSAGQFLTSAQYGSGDIAVFTLGEAGEIIEPAQLINHSGAGPNPARQEGPHAHYAAVLSQQGVLLAVDLGLDSVFAYAIDPISGQIAATPAFCQQTAGGAGPRHLAILSGSKTAYVYCELNDEIYQLELDASGCQVVAVVQAFAQSAGSGSAGAAIKISPDQRHLYVSGRTQAQIACFAIDAHSGKLTALACVDTGGLWPRDFAITPDGTFVVVANENSNEVTSLARDVTSGVLRQTGYSAEVGSPVCVLF